MSGRPGKKSTRRFQNLDAVLDRGSQFRPDFGFSETLSFEPNKTNLLDLLRSNPQDERGANQLEQMKIRKAVMFSIQNKNAAKQTRLIGSENLLRALISHVIA